MTLHKNLNYTSKIQSSIWALISSLLRLLLMLHRQPSSSGSNSPPSALESPFQAVPGTPAQKRQAQKGFSIGHAPAGATSEAQLDFTLWPDGHHSPQYPRSAAENQGGFGGRAQGVSVLLGTCLPPAGNKSL